MDSMATATTTKADAALVEVEKAFDKRRKLAKQLADQDRYIGHIVREARATGSTWAAIAKRSGTSDVAVLKAARRPE